MLQGKGRPLTSLIGQLAVTAVVVAVGIPVTMLAGGMVLVGLTALAHPNPFGLPAGLFLVAGLLLAVAYIWFGCLLVWIRPRQTIWAFQFDGEVLALQTPTGWRRKSV